MTRDDDPEPMSSERTDIASRPTPYDDYTAAMETGRMAAGMRRLRSRSPRFARLLVVLAAVFIGLVATVFALNPPWSDPSAGELGAVSEAEARQAFDEMVALASKQSVSAMERLCEGAVDDCNGLSGAVTAHPESAPGLDAPAPEVLCTFDLNDEGTRLLVVEGEDGFGRPYVAQLVFSERGGDVMIEREPAFWLGVVHNTSTKFTGSVGWTVMHHPQLDVQVGWDVDELLNKARLPCMDR